MRIARGADLTACWDTGRRRHTAHLEVAWRRNARGHPRFGVVVPRFQRTAVARNRLRRRLRELVRRGFPHQLSPVDVVVRARRSAYDAPFAQLRSELADLLSRVS